MAKAKSKKEHYVNNKEFLEALIEYRTHIEEAEAQGKEKPPVTRYIGECFLKIAQHLSYRPNFINYTYKKNMVVDESLIQADHDDAQYTNQYLEFLQENMHDNNSLLRSNDDKYNEDTPEVKKRKVRKGALDEFMGE